MKINQKILSIPPFISTSWRYVASLHIETQEDMVLLIVTLLNGAQIEIPRLSPPIVKAIFSAHVNAMESDSSFKLPAPKISNTQEQVFSFGFPLSEDGGTLDNFGSYLKHDPEQSDAPDLPPGLLNKLTGLSQTLGVKDSALIPQPEPHCNCMHCQIAKALRGGLVEERAETEEIVSDEELKFRIWDIAKTADKLYTVSNHEGESFNVFLGEPVGCTCGSPHCEHIRAVLNS